jgi:hypothetical protein
MFVEANASALKAKQGCFGPLLGFASASLQNRHRVFDMATFSFPGGAGLGFARGFVCRAKPLSSFFVTPLADQGHLR